jgi:phospholipid/cholesterol/gamma-HCH transport system ATP-binding protein
MIEFRHVNYSISGRPILKDVSFLVPAGESRVIMGQSGSGKSTILRLILGLICPDSGEIIVEDQNICNLKSKHLNEIRKRIGMVFQDGALFDSLTVGENVGYYLLENSNLSMDEISGRVSEMLGFVGLSDEIIDRLPDELSGGMQRRVAIGRAFLSTDPKIMLYDEPTTGLDPRMTQNVSDLINRLSIEKKVTTIVVTHQIADAFVVANKFIIIQDGEVVFDGDVNQLRTSQVPVVVDFLEPFRDSIANVRNADFI